MASNLEAAGALKEPSNFAALHSDRIFTGLWTNRSPLRDAATPYLQAKFYSAARYDSLWDGLNAEISPRLTLTRRAGTSVYNANVFNAVSRFYSFRAFSTSSERIRLMVDDGQVWDGTGPSTKQLVLSPSPGAGPTSFQSVGNTLFMGNGVDQKKWVQTTRQWQPGTQFATGDYIVDPSNNLQVVASQLSGQITGVALTDGVLTVSLQAANPFPPGAVVTLNGLQTVTDLNGMRVAVVSGAGAGFTANYDHPDIPQTADTGSASGPSSAYSGGVQPNWQTNPGALTYDGGLYWKCKGSATQPWGIVGPTIAPSTSLGALAGGYTRWAPNTTYSASLLVIDNANNIQQLLQSGITGGGEPAWLPNAGDVTTDGSVKWKNLGSANWQASRAYSAGDSVSVTFTYYVTSYYTPDPNPGDYNYQDQQQQQYTQAVTVTDFFTCNQGGVSDAYEPQWTDGVGVIVSDGSVLWTCQGPSARWTTAAGPNAALSVARVIIDSNGNLQKIVVSGKSGTTEPKWGTATGSSTVDNAASWLNSGPYSGASKLSQTYSYSWANSVTQEESNRSPLSAPVTVTEGKLVVVQGLGPTDFQADTIRIYRTLKGGSTQLRLATIDAPAVSGGLWTYQDASTDDALNVELQAAEPGTNNPPPAGLIALTYHLGRIFGAVSNVVYYSAGPAVLAGSGNSAFPPLNSFTYPSRVVRMFPCSLGLLVFTISDIYIILGSATASDPLYTQSFISGIGLVSYDAFAVNGTTIYIVTNSNSCMSLDPGAGLLEIGFPIANILHTQFSNPYLTFHAQSSDDTALYAADGTTGWYRMAATAAPESGFTWSTRAVITGGCQAVKSIETVPGLRQLLIGPLYRGPILVRDPSVNTDVGTPYKMSATMGSIVLVQPGQWAGLQFITLDALRIGSRAKVSLLLGEVSGEFEEIARTASDPPLLVESSTLYADRYAVMQNGQPAYCRHFMLKMDWPAEDAKNELLAFTVFGQMNSEFKSQ